MNPCSWSHLSTCTCPLRTASPCLKNNKFQEIIWKTLIWKKTNFKGKVSLIRPLSSLTPSQWLYHRVQIVFHFQKKTITREKTRAKKNKKSQKNSHVTRIIAIFEEPLNYMKVAIGYCFVEGKFTFITETYELSFVHSHPLSPFLPSPASLHPPPSPFLHPSSLCPPPCTLLFISHSPLLSSLSPFIQLNPYTLHPFALIHPLPWPA